MNDRLSYFVPAEQIVVEQEIKRSRFIASATRAVDKDSALAFIAEVKNIYPDARHHCYAFIAGCPGNTADIGMSDDGEPQGTAGKPMLSILQYSGIGEIAVVVTRYFGGTKLGTGGLVRAYSSSVQIALEKLRLMEFVIQKNMKIAFSYAFESSVRYIIDKYGITINDIIYEDMVTMKIKFPESIAEQFTKEIIDKTRGSISIMDIL